MCENFIHRNSPKPSNVLFWWKRRMTELFYVIHKNGWVTIYQHNNKCDISMLHRREANLRQHNVLMITFIHVTFKSSLHYHLKQPSLPNMFILWMKWRHTNFPYTFSMFEGYYMLRLPAWIQRITLFMYTVPSTNLTFIMYNVRHLCLCLIRLYSSRYSRYTNQRNNFYVNSRLILTTNNNQ